MRIKVNDSLHLVVPLYETVHGDVERIYAYVHSAPISRAVFESHFLVISQTFASIHGDGLGAIAGPRVAALILREVAKRRNEEASAVSLLNEIRRLSNVLVSDHTGWNTMPLHDAVEHGMLDEDDAAEVENALTFFTVSWHMHRRQIRRPYLDGAASLWGAEITSSDFTAFAATKRTSTAIVNIGESQKQAFSVPV